MCRLMFGWLWVKFSRWGVSYLVVRDGFVEIVSVVLLLRW